MTLLCLMIKGSVIAAAPEWKGVHPIGAPQGTTNRVELIGKWDKWPPSIWTDCETIQFIPEDKEPGCTVVVGNAAQPGAHLIRLFDDQGVSQPGFFVVGDGMEMTESEPNDKTSNANHIPAWPLTINGKLDKRGDVDCFTLKMKKGEIFRASLQAYTLMGKFDGILKLQSADRGQVAWNHDGTTLDPLLHWQVEREGTYILQVMGFRYPANADVSLTGGEGCEYRLHIECLDPLDNPIPTVPPISGATLEKDSDLPLELPVHLFGSIESPGQLDRYLVELRQGDTIKIAIQSGEFQSQLDPWFEIQDNEGTQLKRQDDSNQSHDPELIWTADKDERIRVVVGNLLNRGGPDHIYKLQIEKIGAALELHQTQHSLQLKPGDTTELKLKTRRLYGQNEKLKIICRSPPPGVQVAPVDFPEKDGEVALQWVTAPDAPPYHGPVTLEAVTEGQKTVQKGTFSLITTELNNGVPGGYSQLLKSEVDHLWIHIPEVKPDKEDQENTQKES